MFNGSSLYGGPKRTTNVYQISCDCGKALQQHQTPVTLMRGSCLMTTSTQSDEVKCRFEVNYSQLSDLFPGLPNYMTLDVLPTDEVGRNTGNAFPAVDGWVLHNFDPEPPAFPREEDTNDSGIWPTVVVPRMSQYMASSQEGFVEGDYWIATFHPEKAIVLAHRKSAILFESGETWQIKKTIRFPIQST